MGTSIKNIAGAAIGSLALILLTSEAKALPAAPGTAGGTQYTITQFQGDYNSNIAKFENPCQQRPDALVGQRSNSNALFGCPGPSTGNTQSPPPFSYSPHFAFRTKSNLGTFVIDAIANAGSSSFVTGGRDTESFASAILATPTPTPTAVPVPAPLFGAAAAFANAVVPRGTRRFFLDSGPLGPMRDAGFEPATCCV